MKKNALVLFLVLLIAACGVFGGGVPGDFEWADCDAEMQANCETQCKNRRGVGSCKMSVGTRVVYKNKKLKYESYVVPGSLSCLCLEEDGYCPFTGLGS